MSLALARASSAHMSPLPEEWPDEPAARDERVDDVMTRIAAQLRPVCRSMPPAEFDALVQDVFLEAARFVLRWAEEKAP